MRTIYLAIVFVLTCVSVSQAQAIHYGIKGGLNFSNFRDGSVSGFKFETATNYHAGAFLDFKLLSNLYVQPELLYSTMGAQFERVGYDVKNQLGYISIPVLAKVYINDDNLSIEVGPQFSFLASERNRVGTKTEDYEFGIVAGLGFRLTDMFYLQGRYVLGMSDIKQNSDIKNSAIQVSMGIYLN